MLLKIWKFFMQTNSSMGNPPQYATVANKGGKFPDHPPIEQSTGCLVVSKIPKMQRVTSLGVVESNRVGEELATQQRK
jgi:hypothetical protein